MKLLCVNVSLPRNVVHGRTTVETGVFKRPVAGQVMLRKKNREGAERGPCVRTFSPGWRRSFEERLLEAGAIYGSGVSPREGRPE